MSLPQRELQSTVAAYLAAERETEERNEYLDGFIYRMAGESPEHGAICTNLTASLHTQLLGTPCQVFSKDTKVRSGPLPERFNSTKGLFSYPRCGSRLRQAATPVRTSRRIAQSDGHY